MFGHPLQLGELHHGVEHLQAVQEINKSVRLRHIKKDPKCVIKYKIDDASRGHRRTLTGTRLEIGDETGCVQVTSHWQPAPAVEFESIWR